MWRASESFGQAEIKEEEDDEENVIVGVGCERLLDQYREHDLIVQTWGEKN
jgi:hypothetical protein